MHYKIYDEHNKPTPADIGAFSNAGGSLSGPLYWNGSSLPQFSGQPSYLLGIESFAEGGTTKWQEISNIRVGSAFSADQADRMMMASHPSYYLVGMWDGNRFELSAYAGGQRQNTVRVDYADTAGWAQPITMRSTYDISAGATALGDGQIYLVYQ